MVWQGELPGVIGRASGLKTKLVAVGGAHTNVYLVVLASSSIRSLSDLRGKRVLLSRQSGQFLATRRILDAHGLSLSDIQPVEMDDAAMMQALTTSAIDAAFMGSTAFQLERQGFVQIIYGTKSQDRSFRRHFHVLVTDEFARKHDAWVQRIVDRYVDAAEWASQEENREALFQLWATVWSARGQLQGRVSGRCPLDAQQSALRFDTDRCV